MAGRSVGRTCFTVGAIAAGRASGPRRAGGRGRAGDYDDWTVVQLRERAAELGIRGRSTMVKAELIEALRDH